MRERATFTALGFESTHDALSAEIHLKAAGLTVVPIPAPQALGTLCGIALRIPLTSATSAEETLASSGIAISGSVTLEDWV